MDKNKLAIDVFNRRATEYQQKYMDTVAYHASLQVFSDYLTKPNANLLEVGCGPGNVTRYLLDIRPDFSILATDLAPNMLKLAQQNNPEASFACLDCRSILKVNQKQDGLLAAFCLPYLTKTEALQFIKDVAQILHPNGVFYLSTMEGSYSASGLATSSSGDSLYMYYHQADYLTKALEENGFQVRYLNRLHSPQPAASPSTDLILIGQKVASLE